MPIDTTKCAALMELIERLTSLRDRGTIDREIAEKGIKKATAELKEVLAA